MSLFRYILSEVTRSYGLEDDHEMYTTRREKMYTFMRIPRELEKFMSYGFFHCLDSFLFIFTFLPLRMLLACAALLVRIPLNYGSTSGARLLYPAEIIDLLKCFIIGSCCYAMSYVDTSMLYHMIKSQSVIKLYLMYNMIEVADRLFSAFGQDSIDALFWTATEPRGKKREHIGIIPHVLLAAGYVFLHSMLVLLQATTLNVAINASNKALLTIMMSNNFVELKGSVFKKFDRNNLFQVSCSDVRERFHLFALLFVVVVQTMKEYGWREDSFWTLAPDCLLVLGAEILVDWLKHAFITRFNEVPADVYKDYTISLAYDLAQTKHKHAFSDHSDIVSRKMGFIPLPLGVVMLRVVYTSVKSTNPGAWAVVLMAYLCLLTFRILGSIVILGKAVDLVNEHKGKQEERKKPSTGIEPSGPAPAVLLAGVGAEVEPLPATASPDLPGLDLFQLPSDPAEHRKMSEVTDVILVKMNPLMKEVERVSEEEEPMEEARPSPGRSRKVATALSSQEDILSRQEDIQPHQEDIQPHQEDIPSRQEDILAHQEDIQAHQEDIQPHQEDILAHQEDILAHEEDIVNMNITSSVSSLTSVFSTGDLAKDRCQDVPVNHIQSNIANGPSGNVASEKNGTESNNLLMLASTSPPSSPVAVPSPPTGPPAGLDDPEETEAVLRYRTVQRSMSSPDLVLEGLADWQAGRGQADSGGPE